MPICHIGGAQRLAASQEKSLSCSSLHRVHQRQCSTPRGITGKIAIEFGERDSCAARCSTPRGITGKIARMKRLPSCQSSAVLNASRHHRKNRVLNSASQSHDCDVLNASRHHRKNRLMIVCSERLCDGAQRLAASQEKSRIGAAIDRCSCCMVLNASRHHRKNRPTLRYQQPQGAGKCSTPRGITGKIAAAIVCGLTSRRRVLNASRHHRKNRTPISRRQSSAQCSTPRGITGKIARWRSRHCPSSCSTPRGITGKIARSQLSMRQQLHRKCSTPRGITGKIAARL